MDAKQMDLQIINKIKFIYLPEMLKTQEKTIIESTGSKCRSPWKRKRKMARNTGGSSRGSPPTFAKPPPEILLTAAGRVK